MLLKPNLKSSKQISVKKTSKRLETAMNKQFSAEEKKSYTDMDDGAFRIYVQQLKQFSAGSQPPAGQQQTSNTGATGNLHTYLLIKLQVVKVDTRARLISMTLDQAYFRCTSICSNATRSKKLMGTNYSNNHHYTACSWTMISYAT